MLLRCYAGDRGPTQQNLQPKHGGSNFFIGIMVLVFCLATLLLAFTLGSNGTEGRAFTEDIKQAETSNIISSFAGGVIFNLANILLVAAIGIAGMSVAFPVGIGIALVLGVIVNYISNPQGNPLLIFGGVALIALAIILNARAYQKLQSNSAEKFQKKD